MILLMAIISYKSIIYTCSNNAMSNKGYVSCGNHQQQQRCVLVLKLQCT